MSYRSRQIADALSGAIGAQDLPPGFKLGERILSEICGTSRAVIKQALIILSREGLVEMVPNKGACVAELSGHAVLDIFEALAAIEQGAAFQLAERLTGADWDRLESNVTAAQCCLDTEASEEADRLGQEFHSHLVALVDNPMLMESHARLTLRSQLLRQHLISVAEQGRHLNDDHGRILTLLKTRQTTEAMRMIGAHYAAIARGFRLAPAKSANPDLEAVMRRWLAKITDVTAAAI